ncbi:MAG TPA: 30S ribosomal protein S6 [Candidatus Moranbacteria bacterium]|nr:30S ribosomal protein S6 [Candidatus Moranbacteria bacterium]
MQYELFYLVGERQEANLEAIKENVKSLLVSHQAKLLEPELSEKRKLSYEIKHQRKGVYVTRRFELPEADDQKESPLREITKKLNLSNEVLRFMIVKTDDLPELDSKEKRKAREMAAQTQSSQRTPRSAEKQPAYRQPRKQEQPKPAQAPQPTKEETKDIDKQLDKLLDI